MTLTSAKITTIDVRKPRAAARAEARGDPLGAGGHVRAAQPARQVHHQENLVEDGPQPRNPDALQAVDEQQVDQPHGARDIEHAGSVGDAQEIPGQDISAQEIRFRVPRGAVRDPVAQPARRSPETTMIATSMACRFISNPRLVQQGAVNQGRQRYTRSRVVQTPCFKLPTSYQSGLEGVLRGPAQSATLRISG